MNETETMSEIVAGAVGRTVKTITQAHRPDENDPSGAVVVEFTDGGRLRICGVWCNDSTADTEVEWDAS